MVAAANVPTSIPSLPLFLALVILSAIASKLKLKLPLLASSSNLSVAYTVDFCALLLLGPDLAMLVALLSAWSQSTYASGPRNPVHRTLFNLATLALTVQAAGSVFVATGGRPGIVDPSFVAPLLAAVLTYYLVNSLTVATAVGLSAGQPVGRVWHQNFLWTAPSYFAGALGASAAAAAWTAGVGWLIPLAAAPVYLTFRSYRTYLDRIDSERRHAAEMEDMHRRTIAALRSAEASEQRYRLAAQGSNDGLWDWDLVTGAFFVSERWNLMMGFPSAVACDRVEDWFRLIHADDEPEFRRSLDRHLAGESEHFEHQYRVWHQDGQHRWMLCRGVAVRDESGRAVRMAGSQTDISERQRVQEQLTHAALHDGLTGLPNRAFFTQHLELALAKIQRAPASHVCAVLFVDLDRFKLVNDSFGHLAGDRVLVEVSRRIQYCLRPGDVLARLGGDEFAILLTDATDPRIVSSISDRIQETLSAPVVADGREYLAKASVGIAFSSAHCRTSEDLLRDADTAMYRAKDMGRSQAQTFEPSMHAAALGRLTLETELRRALERHEFTLHYQPIVDLVTFEVSGFEALIRWPRGDGSLVAPVDFVPVAEDTALIAPLTRWVVAEACSQIAVWQRRFGLPLSVSVNISTKLFDRPTLVDEVRAAIASTGLLPGTLRLEVTESFLVSDTAAVERRLSELRSIPVGLYLDDFGTGYSSLSYLHRYQIDALKIDRSFISRIGTTANDAPIVSSIVNLARELRMGVIAEGVETVTQAEHLIALGCPYAQGLFFSAPLSVEETESFLRARPTLRSLVHPRTATSGHGYVPLTH